MQSLIIVAVKKKYKVYRETKYTNGYCRRLVKIFSTKEEAVEYVNATMTMEEYHSLPVYKN
jgi:hypothetical protein